MLNVNPTNSTQIANSVQNDYRQAAADYRLAKESGYQSNSKDTGFKVAIVLSTITIALFAISQVATF